MPFPHPILGHSNAIHILTLFAYDAHKKYDPPIYIPTAARRETGTWQAVTGILTSTHTHTLRFLQFSIILRLVTTVQSSFGCAPWFLPWPFLWCLVTTSLPFSHHLLTTFRAQRLLHISAAETALSNEQRFNTALRYINQPSKYRYMSQLLHMPSL